MTAKERSQQTSRVILVIASMLVIAALGYFAYQYFSQKEENREDQIKIDKLESEILDLESKILDFEVVRDSQQDDLQEQALELTETLTNLKEYQKLYDIANKEAKKSSKELAIMTKRLSNLEKMVKQYKTQIDQLIAEKEILEQQLDSARVYGEEMENRSDSLLAVSQDQSDEIIRINRLGSVLKTNNFHYKSLKDNGKERDNIKGKILKKHQAANIEICFNILDNPVASSGQRDLFLVLEGLDGNVITNSEDGFSGSFYYKGRKKTYTSRHTLNYRKKNVGVCIPFTKSKDFKYTRGPVFVRVYSSDGDLIGQNQFEVK
ncbi:MAG: hypothetical protein AAFY71_25355 [Bacteroidota bacterium]